MTKRSITIIILVLLVAGAVGWYFYRNMAFQPPDARTRDEGSIDSSVESDVLPGSSIRVEGSGEYTVEAIPIPASGIEYPSLRRPIVFSAAFSAEAQGLMRQKIEASITVLEKNPRDFGEWTVFAMHRKVINDFEGARQIWEFLTKTNPEQLGLYINLATLYAFDLKNQVLAEKNFSEALRRGAKEVAVYRNAYDFYRYVQKDDEKAKAILKTGIVETSSPDLQYLLDHYNEF